MKLAATYLVPGPRERVFAAITDPLLLQQCIDGCERMVQTGPDTYDAHLKIGLAGLKGTYIGKIRLADVVAPHTYTLHVEGKGGPGFLKAVAHFRLEDKADHTDLHCQADAQVGGLIAAIGSRLIEGAAKKMMDGFFKRFALLLEGRSGAGPGAGAAPS